MQVWPALDDFAHGSPAYGQHVIGYLGCVATSSHQAGRLHDGYGGASPRAQNQSDTTGNAAGFLRRQAFPAPMRVRLVSRKQAVAGVADVSHLKKHQVFARVTAGTLAGNGTDHVRLENITGYTFSAEWVPASGLLRFRLQRLDAGVATTLTTVDDTSGLAGNFLTDTELILEVTDNGAGNVELKGYASNLVTDPVIAAVVYQPGGSGQKTVSTAASPKPGVPLAPHAGQVGKVPVFGAAAAVLVVSAIDASGSKITAGGRCGFAIDPERVITTPAAANVVSVATLFEVADLTVPAAPAVLWRDEWSRAAPSLLQAMTDRFGTSGRNLASDYGCDQASVETVNILKRSTVDHSAESPTTFDDGQAVLLDGVDDDLELYTPIKTFNPPTVTPAQLELSIAIWARIDENRDGNELYAAITTLVSPSDGFAFGWRTGTGSNFKLQARLGKGGAGGVTTLNSPERAASSHIGQAWLYAMTYKANANPSTGEGRVRFYVGRVGQATLLGEVAVPADTRPTWLLDERHYLGFRDEFSGGTAVDKYLKGALDEAHVFYDELSEAQVALLANPGTDPAATFPGLALAGGWHLDAFTNVSGENRSAPWFASAATGIPADTADWLRLVGATILTAGLVPVQPASRFVALAQRAADSATDQHRSILFRPASDASIGGVVVRGAPGPTAAQWSGYRLDVAPGSPAPIALYRVVAGVATKLASQDPGGAIAVSSGAYVAAALQVQQQPGGGALGPVQLTVRVGGLVVPMVSQHDDALVDLDGAVVDVGDARLLSGPLEGFWGLVDGLGNRFDDFSVGALDGPTSADGVASYAFPEEADGAEGDLADVLTPSWEVERRAPAAREELVFESGHLHRVVLDAYERRRFTLRRLGLSEAEWQAFDAFVAAHGPAVPFQWDPGFFLEEEQAGYWRFVDGTVRTWWENGARAVSCELEEARAPAAS